MPLQFVALTTIERDGKAGLKEVEGRFTNAFTNNMCFSYKGLVYRTAFQAFIL